MVSINIIIILKLGVKNESNRLININANSKK